MLGIEVADSGYGTGLTPAVAAAVDRVTEAIAGEIRERTPWRRAWRSGTFGTALGYGIE